MCFLIIFLSFDVIQIAPEYKRRKAIRRCFSRTQTRNETFGEHKKKEGLKGFISESRNDVNGLLHESIPQLSGVRYRPKIKNTRAPVKNSFADLSVEEGGSYPLVCYFFVWPKREKVFRWLKPLIKAFLKKNSQGKEGRYSVLPPPPPKTA